MRILGVLRGRPGLGHVTPGLGLLEWCARAGHTVEICTYANGVKLLARKAPWPVHDLGIDGPYHAWAGLDVIDHLCLKLGPIVKRWRPDVIVAGGEYLLPIESKRWGVQVALIYNPEVLVAKPHNEPYRGLFNEVLGACDLLVCQARPPRPDEIWPESRSLLERSIHFGQLMRPCGARAEREPRSATRVVFSNGGGILLPDSSATYASDATPVTEWKRQNYETTLETLRCLSGERDVLVDAFLCIPDDEQAAIRAQVSAPHIRLHAFSLDYLACLAGADLAICRAGASSVSEIEALGVRALLWPLRNHAEQERTVREFERASTRINGIWGLDTLRATVQAALAEVRAARLRDASDADRFNERGMERYVRRVEQLGYAARSSPGGAADGNGRGATMCSGGR